MSTATWRRSPVFWGAVAAASGVAGAVLWRRRQNLLGRGRSRSGEAGPTPKLILKNPAKPMAPVATVKVDGMTMRRFESTNITIHDRLKQIQEQVWAGYNDPRMRDLALQLTKNCGRDDGPCEIDTIFAAVKRNVRYTGDGGPVKNMSKGTPSSGLVEATDIYQSPWRTWTSHGGDCDDHVSTIATLLALLGHEVRLRVSAPGRIGDYEHIYAVVGEPKLGPKKWKAVDTTLPGTRLTAGGQARYGKAQDYMLEVPA